MTITLEPWQTGVLILLILIATGTLTHLGIRIGTALHRRWSAQMHQRNAMSPIAKTRHPRSLSASGEGRFANVHLGTDEYSSASTGLTPTGVPFEPSLYDQPQGRAKRKGMFSRQNY